jgi:hypothetical protein
MPTSSHALPEGDARTTMRRFRSAMTFSQLHAEADNQFKQERHLVARDILQTETPGLARQLACDHDCGLGLLARPNRLCIRTGIGVRP